jgi:translocation and assembly module TamA
MPYSQDKLLAFQGRLRDSQYFAGAFVTAEPDPDHPGVAPVHVLVREQPARKLAVGVGMSTDAGPRGSVAYRDLNLLGRAWRLSGNLVADVKQQAMNGELAFPQAAAGYRDGLYGKTVPADIGDLVTRGYSLGAKRSRLRGRIGTTVAGDYTTERQELAGSFTDSIQALTGSYTWIWREVDDLVYPSRGYLLSVQTGAGNKALLSDQDFLRGYGRFAYSSIRRATRPA